MACNVVTTLHEPPMHRSIHRYRTGGGGTGEFPRGNSLGGFPGGNFLGGVWLQNDDFGSQIVIFKIEDYQIARNFEANPMEMVPHARNTIKEPIKGL